jgi:hypothetical protein
LASQFVLVAAFLMRSDKALSDFPAFYAVARLWQKGERAFDLESQCREERAILHGGLPCLPLARPPILLPVLSVVVSEDFVASYWRWVAVLVLVLLVSLYPLYRLTGEISTSVQAILCQPVVAGVWLGQDNAVLLTAIFFFVWFLQEKRDFLAGVALSLTTIKPHFALALALPLLFVRRRAFLGFVTGSSVLVVYSLALVGLEGFRDLINLAGVLARGRGYGIWREGMVNAAGLLSRIGLNSEILLLLIFLVGVVAIAWYWRARGVNENTIAIALVIVIFTVPHAHPSDAASLVLPLALLGLRYVMLSSAVLFALMPARLVHWGFYAIMAGLVVANVNNGEKKRARDVLSGI